MSEPDEYTRKVMAIAQAATDVAGAQGPQYCLMAAVEMIAFAIHHKALGDLTDAETQRVLTWIQTTLTGAEAAYQQKGQSA